MVVMADVPMAKTGAFYLNEDASQFFSHVFLQPNYFEKSFFV
jgi:hypothetical protein